MLFKSVVAMIGFSAAAAMAFPAAVPSVDESHFLVARTEQAAQAAQAAQHGAFQQAIQQLQSGQVSQLSQAQQSQALQFATQQGAFTNAGQWVDPYNYWGQGWGWGTDYYTQLLIWYYLSLYGGGYNWNGYCYYGYC